MVPQIPSRDRAEEEAMSSLKAAEKLEYLKMVPLFQTLTKRQLNAIAKKTYQQTIDAGKTIAAQGEAGHEFFIIVDGVARVEKNGKLVRTLSQGGYFGEIALLDGKARTASVVADGEVHLLCVNKTSFTQLLDDVPGLQDRVLSSLCKYLRNAEKALSEKKK
jgi:CRP-like cAMP-binding protein